MLPARPEQPALVSAEGPKQRLGLLTAHAAGGRRTGHAPVVARGGRHGVGRPGVSGLAYLITRIGWAFRLRRRRRVALAVTLPGIRFAFRILVRPRRRLAPVLSAAARRLRRR